MCLAPDFVNRYMVSATPPILLAIPTVLSMIQNHRRTTITASLIILLYIAFPLFKRNIDNLYQDCHLWLTAIVPQVKDDITYHVRDTLLTNDRLKSGDIVIWHNKKTKMVNDDAQSSKTIVWCYIRGERPCDKDIANKSTVADHTHWSYEFSVIK